MTSLVKVSDAGTLKLKRWESPTGQPLAIVEGRKLVLTNLGKRLGYKVRKMHLVERKRRPQGNRTGSKKRLRRGSVPEVQEAYL